MFLAGSLRIGSCLMVAPLFGASYVPPRVRIVLAGAITLAALPLIPRSDGLTLLSADGVVTTVQQMVIGAALGYALQLMFDALTLGGQLLANGMGLGLAFNIDPLRGVDTARARATLCGTGHADLHRIGRPHCAAADPGGKLPRSADRAKRFLAAGAALTGGLG